MTGRPDENLWRISEQMTPCVSATCIARIGRIGVRQLVAAFATDVPELGRGLV